MVAAASPFKKAKHLSMQHHRSVCVQGGGAGMTPEGYGLWKSSGELNLIETDDL